MERNGQPTGAQPRTDAGVVLNARIGRGSYLPGKTAEAVAADAAGEMDRVLERLAWLAEDSKAHPHHRQRDDVHEIEWDLLQCISRVLDAHDPRGRGAQPEGVYEVVTLADDEAGPKTGATRLEDAELGVRAVIRKVHPLRGRWAGGIRVYGVKVDVEETAETAASAPRNYQWGFFGEWTRDNAERFGLSAADAWKRILERFGTGTGTAPRDRELAEILDSRAGRHYSDELGNTSAEAPDFDQRLEAVGRPRDWTRRPGR